MTTYSTHIAKECLKCHDVQFFFTIYSSSQGVTVLVGHFHWLHLKLGSSNKKQTKNKQPVNIRQDSHSFLWGEL